MDASELKTYEQQLAQVQGALVTDKDNKELINLEVELRNLIDLTKQLIGQGETSTSTSTAAPSTSTKSIEAPSSPSVAKIPTASQTRRFAAGEECQAKYDGDGRWYSARIVSVGGSLSDPKYTVLYKGYDSTEIVTSDSLRPLKNAPGSHAVVTSAGGQPVTSTGSTAQKRSTSSATKLTPEEETERERKRKRSEKKAERSANKSAEANAMQNNWQKFAKKAEKKGTLKADKSMFKTPEDPLAKVGVVGAGRGMTQFGDRKKHVYEAD